MLIHVVKARETLWQIANNYRVSMTAIVTTNELPNPNQLVIGQALVIPSEDVFHTVKSGETLWKIAQTYGTTVQIILQNNQFVNPANIFPGLLIYIPAFRHRIQAGETLRAISQIYGVSLQNLIKVNNIIDTNLVYPGTILVIPLKPRPPMSVNAYIYVLGEDAVPIIKKDGKHLTYLSPFAYLIKEDGSLQPINDIPAIQVAKVERAIPMMSIINFTATAKGENLANIILNSPTIVERLLTNIIKAMKEKGYLGINIDFENVIPADRESYNSFLNRAVNSLHLEGFFVSTALAPKVSGAQTGALYEAHDYEAHGKIVDFVVLMTYEWDWRMGRPQAISPLNQIKRVLDYAITVIPRKKIYFGFQIYARDWLLPHIEGQEAETFSCQDTILRTVKYGAVIQYDSLAQSPFYRYTDEQLKVHEVWFEDARSAQAKFNVVKNYNLKGMSYWVLGYPFPQNWALLEDNFTIQK